MTGRSAVFSFSMWSSLPATDSLASPAVCACCWSGACGSPPPLLPCFSSGWSCAADSNWTKGLINAFPSFVVMLNQPTAGASSAPSAQASPSPTVDASGGAMAAASATTSATTSLVTSASSVAWITSESAPASTIVRELATAASTGSLGVASGFDSSHGVAATSGATASTPSPGGLASSSATSAVAASAGASDGNSEAETLPASSAIPTATPSATSLPTALSVAAKSEPGGAAELATPPPPSPSAVEVAVANEGNAMTLARRVPGAPSSKIRTRAPGANVATLSLSMSSLARRIAPFFPTTSHSSPTLTTSPTGFSIDGGSTCCPGAEEEVPPAVSTSVLDIADVSLDVQWPCVLPESRSRAN
mmetsp:Transcript_128540/g.333211  ORF Transcript_128540/g.333211 Transcript_128540/m.333211 type:complete len:363 (+) Transcript_128540:1184-2272(+)